MKREKTTEIYDKVFKIKENHDKINELVKAVIINFGDERGDIIVENDNFGTDRKYADFTKGKEKAGLNPLQIVFSGIESARICHDRYIDKDGNVCDFANYPKSIKEARQEAGLTQQSMSDLLGIPKRTIENWEAGSRKCPEWTEKLIIDKLERIKTDI